MQIRLHKLLVQVHLVETSRPGVLDDVQVVEAGNLPTPNPQERKGRERTGKHVSEPLVSRKGARKRACQPAKQRGQASSKETREKEGGGDKAGRTFLCPLKWCKSLISLRHRLERIFLEKMFVI